MNSPDPHPRAKPMAVHALLTEWVAGRLDWREAVRRVGVDTTGELYRAAVLSGVPVRAAPNDSERRSGHAVADLLRAAAVR